MANAVVQAHVVSGSTPNPTQDFIQLALFNSSGQPLSVGKQMPVQADTVAVDLAALKVDFNALLAKLKTAGLMASS